MGYRIGIDIGGTFTDFALLKGTQVIVHKNLSTPEDRSIGVMNGLEILADKEGLKLHDFLGQCDAIVHATTVADNALIEMNGALTGLITTEGFRDEIEYRRGFKEDIWDVRLAPPKQITQRRRRLTVSERVLFNGSIHKPLDEDSVRAACRKLRKQGVKSVAVSLLFSFINPAHEKRIGQIIAEELPGANISLSHQVLPRGPEYDRTSTTVVNAYIAPPVTTYIERLASRLKENGYPRQLLVMQANGGVMTKEYIDGAPIRVLASGPVGGVAGSAYVGTAKGHPNLLCVDLGGTSYDMSLVINGTAPAEAGWNMHHRYLIGVPMVKVETLGAGGGSICHVQGGALKVGPASAGSVPGPIAYGKGGTQPTVTDALVMLGILSTEESFAGGSFRLSREGVDAAFQKLGDEMGYSAEDAAFDCWRIVNANMTQGVRRTVASQGSVEPHNFTMLAYGGNGPAFAAVQADDLGITRVLIPKTSPTFSALGTLVANPSIDEERSYTAKVNALDIPRMKALWNELATRAEKFFADAQFKREDIVADYQLNMRYAGQNFALTFGVHPNGALHDLSFADDALGERALAMFNERHLAEYNHIREHELPEVIGVRLATHVVTPSPTVAMGFETPAQPAAPTKTRRANLGQGFAETPIFYGNNLKPGHIITGPAIIHEVFTTIVVYPGWQARVDDAGDYELIRLP